MIRKGKCTNFGNCTVADTRQVVSVSGGNDLLCPDCGRQLTEVATAKPASLAAVPVMILVGLLLLIGIAVAYWMMRSKSSSEPTTASDKSGQSTASLPAPPVGSKVALRLHGSNTIGAQLAPALLEGFLKQQGATEIHTVPASHDESRIEAKLPGDSAIQVFEVAAHGSSTAFTDLGSGSADIGMSSRKIKPEEVAKLSDLGDLTSAASEHVLGLDGIAIIVNRSNGVAALTKEQIAGIFTGKIKDWSDVGGTGGPIRTYALDNRSGTYDTFKTLVLGSGELTADTARLEAGQALSEKVAGDPSGIGFVGLPYIAGSKAVAVSEKGTKPRLPNAFTVATEDYTLSRRLYLYTASSPKNPLVQKFIDFAMSKAGQNIVGDSKFVSQNVEAQTVSTDAANSSEYKTFTKGAQRLSVNFQFKTGSPDLDNKAVADLDRVVSLLSDLHYGGDKVMLFGFADSSGSPGANEKLSKERAKTVAAQFEPRGVTPKVVTGFGADNPIASNDSDDGRQKNRRVEIWVTKN
jgi:phosphate transport system substrate-binding protein